MKKPNITEGDWEYLPNKDCSDNPELISNRTEDGYYIICEPLHILDADAKAISAVPEMMDALIDAYYLIDPDGGTDSEIESHEKISKALAKAGVEL